MAIFLVHPFPFHPQPSLSEKLDTQSFGVIYWSLIDSVLCFGLRVFSARVCLSVVTHKVRTLLNLSLNCLIACLIGVDSRRPVFLDGRYM